MMGFFVARTHPRADRLVQELTARGTHPMALRIFALFACAVALEAAAAARTGFRPMLHDAPAANQQTWVDALADFGCAGAVVACPMSGGFTSNPTNLAVMGEFLARLREAGLSYWIYDEVGYPSGAAGGLALEGHPEMEAKGFYMRKFVALDESKTFDFRRECDADKIVYAAKYALKPNRSAMGEVDWNSCRPVDFSADAACATVGPDEVFYVFSVRSAYEGSHLVHNVFSRKRSINIMDPKAVRRFIDVAYEPIARALPEAYAHAGGVFTDEPSLQTCFAFRPEAMWNWALLPWKEGLFEDYAAAYGGERLERLLPVLFEGGFAVPEVCRTRVRYHELVGRLVAEAWAGQLSDWCRRHGTRFSGHYLFEEFLPYHVAMYGNLFTVLKAMDYPGVDALACTPETYDFRTGKYIQLAVRKKGTRGAMVEICPCNGLEQFKHDPVGNFRAVASEMFLSDIREVQSYCQPDFAAYRNGALAKEYPSDHGLLAPAYNGIFSLAQAREANGCIARLVSALGGLSPRCSVFVYVNVNEIQARYIPRNWGRPMFEPDACEREMTIAAERIYNSGHDFMFVDDEDIAAAAHDAQAVIAGLPARVVVVPPSVVLSSATLRALGELKAKGVKVLFLGSLPQLGTDGEALPQALLARFSAVTVEAVDEAVRTADSGFVFSAPSGKVLHAEYALTDGERHYFVNKNRQPVMVTVEASIRPEGRFENLVTGVVGRWRHGEPLELPALGAAVLDFKTGR